MVLKVVPELSPRLLTVPIADGTSISMQEVVDQLRDFEDEPFGMNYPRLVLASGKDDLGGGLAVGITVQLQDGQIEFEERTAPASAGTATSADVNGSVLTDTGATFIADGVVRGSWIVNFTDQSVSTVLTVDSETQITHKVLVEGTGNDWGIGDAYKIWNITQVELDGGNATAVNTVGGSISPVYTSFGNQVVRTSSSSATLQEISASDLAGVAASVWSLILTTGFTAEDILLELWKLQGLDASNPMTVTPSSRLVNGVAQTITGDGVTTSTVTRT